MPVLAMEKLTDWELGSAVHSVLCNPDATPAGEEARQRLRPGLRQIFPKLASRYRAERGELRLAYALAFDAAQLPDPVSFMVAWQEAFEDIQLASHICWFLHIAIL